MIDAMPRPQLIYLLKERTRHGKTVYYVRLSKTSPRIRIKGEYYSEQFMAEYRAAIAGDPVKSTSATAHKGSLKWLADRWRESSDWHLKARSTKRQRENILLQILADNGQLRYALLAESDIVAGRERRMKTPFAANNFLKTMKAMFAWAKETKLVDVDPAASVKFLSVKTGGHEPWTQGDVAAFRARHPIGTRARVALETVYLTGLRRGDACRLGKQHIGKDGMGRIRMEKTGRTVSFAVHPYLVHVWEQGPTSDLTFICDSDLKPYGKEAFGNAFRDWCREAGVEKSAHGLRKLAASETAEGGGSEIELQKYFGWGTVGQSSTYTREANADGLAKSAAGKRFANAAIPAPGDRYGDERKKQ